MKTSIGSKVFATKKEALNYLNSLAKRSWEHCLSGDEYEAVKAVLMQRRPALNPEIEYKIKSIWVAGNYAFHYRNSNGEWEAFSYRKFVYRAMDTSEAKAIQAMRMAVAYDINCFKQDDSEYAAELHSLDSKQIHADHEYEFRHLVSDFRKERELDLSRVKTITDPNQPPLRCLADKTLEREWVEYHRQHAKLRLVSKQENLRRKRLA